MPGKEAYAQINRLLNTKLREKGALVAAHRGCRAGNIVGNTLPAFQAAFAMGADLVEMDVIRSTDGRLYTFHDGTEAFAFHDPAYIKTLSGAQIEGRTLFNSLDEPSGYHAERLETVLRRFTGGEIFNIDRAWDIFPELDEALARFPGALGRVILKAPLLGGVLDFLERCPRKYMFMPILDDTEGLDALLARTGINTVGVEARAWDAGAGIFGQETLDAIYAKGLYVWANALALSDRYRGFGGLDDDLAIREGPEKSWGILFRKHIRIVQTDWPALLSRYRDAFFAREDA